MLQFFLGTGRFCGKTHGNAATLSILKRCTSSSLPQTIVESQDSLYEKNALVDRNAVCVSSRRHSL